MVIWQSELRKDINYGEIKMNVGLILLILLIIVLIGALPVYPYSASWGYGPSGGAGLIVLILLILLLTGRL
jgi:hypothetical protein